MSAQSAGILGRRVAQGWRRAGLSIENCPYHGRSLGISDYEGIVSDPGEGDLDKSKMEQPKNQVPSSHEF